MTLTLLSRPVTVVHTTATSVDTAGRPTRTTTSTSVNAGYRHRSSADSFDGGLIVTDEITFYLPPTTVVSASDTILLGTESYEVVSEPFEAWNHRRADVHHLEVRARRVTR